MKRTLLFALAAASFSSSSLAQDLTFKAPAQANTIVIKHATIHTVSGAVIQDGAIFFSQGVIGGVMTTAELERKSIRWRQPPVVEIDAAGKHVYPGLISANTIIGLTEISAVRSTNDSSEVGDVSPEVRAAVAVNPDSTIIPVTRSNGILTAAVLPEGGAIPGRLSVMRLDGWTWEDMAIQSDAGLLINWPRVLPIHAWWMTKSDKEQLEESTKSLAVITDAFNAAEAYFKAKDADPAMATDLRWEAMRGALRKGEPVFIGAQELEQMESAIEWAAAHNLKTVIVGGRDSALCLDLLKRRDVAVIVTGTQRLPRRRDSAYDEPFTLPATLEKAGVRWCLATGGGGFMAAHERNLPYHAAQAIAYGLDHDVALRSITLSAAEILGVGDVLGSIEPGKAATLIITDGDPLEITTHVERAFIDGRQIDLSNKQKVLNRKYREKYRQLGILPREGDDN